MLVFANKQDLPNALSVTELTEKLGLNQLRRKVQFSEKNLRKYNYSFILLILNAILYFIIVVCTSSMRNSRYGSVRRTGLAEFWTVQINAHLWVLCPLSHPLTIPSQFQVQWRSWLDETLFCAFLPLNSVLTFFIDLVNFSLQYLFSCLGNI